ncbi:hypothetical protein ACFQX8_19710 [Klenkia terrae]|uniref:hypothetical protein n=1 Tax=Klenkia terrae TaxID=1052259 RepID=UPI003619CCEE
MGGALLARDVPMPGADGWGDVGPPDVTPHSSAVEGGLQFADFVGDAGQVTGVHVMAVQLAGEFADEAVPLLVLGCRS